MAVLVASLEGMSVVDLAKRSRLAAYTSSAFRASSLMKIKGGMAGRMKRRRKRRGEERGELARGNYIVIVSSHSFLL